MGMYIFMIEIFVEKYLCENSFLSPISEKGNGTGMRKSNENAEILCFLGGLCRNFVMLGVKISITLSTTSVNRCSLYLVFFQSLFLYTS
jgi:hypothetical protein